MKKIDADGLREVVRNYWSVIRGLRGVIMNCLAWIVLMQVLSLSEPYAVKYVIDDVLVAKEQSLTEVVSVLFTLFLVLEVGGVVNAIKNFKCTRILFQVERDVLFACARKLVALPLSFHERESEGLLISKVTKGIQKTIDITASLLFEIFSLGIQTAVTAVIIGFISPRALGVFLGTVVVFTWVTYKVKQRLAPFRKRRHEEDGTAYEWLGQATANIATVQAFAQEEFEVGRIEKLWNGIFDRGVKEYSTHYKFDALRNAIVSFGRIVVIGICAWAALGDSLSKGSFVFVVMLTDSVFKGCYRIGSIFDRLQEASESVNRMAQVLETEEAIKDPSNPVDAPHFEGAIRFERVTHQYPQRLPSKKDARKSSTALADIDLSIAAGETFAIVGPSGGGKSTLVKLLMRMIDPTRGEIRLDGIDLRDMRRAEFRRQIGYVPQEVEINDGTVAENIAYGRPDATHDEIVAAAKVANAHEFIMGLEDGYATIVGNKGMRLSGGQRQRIGIARAIVVDPRILIFDEATSHVDSISEAKIQAAIEKLRVGRTIIIIAHRLSTVRRADRIAVMEDGRIKEIGTHAELMRDQGLYNRLISLQNAMEEAM